MRPRKTQASGVGDLFRARLDQAPRDAEHALEVVTEHCRSDEGPSFFLASLWASLTAINGIEASTYRTGEDEYDTPEPLDGPLAPPPLGNRLPPDHEQAALTRRVNNRLDHRPRIEQRVPTPLSQHLGRNRLAQRHDRKNLALQAHVHIP